MVASFYGEERGSSADNVSECLSGFEGHGGASHLVPSVIALLADLQIEFSVQYSEARVQEALERAEFGDYVFDNADQRPGQRLG